MLQCIDIIFSVHFVLYILSSNKTLPFQIYHFNLRIPLIRHICRVILWHSTTTWHLANHHWRPASNVKNSTGWIRINYLLFLEDNCRCSLQHAAGHSGQAAEVRCHTRPATTSQCSGLHACRGCCHTHWCRSHTDALQTLEWKTDSVTDIRCNMLWKFSKSQLPSSKSLY